MISAAYTNQNRPRPTPGPYMSQPTRQECQWLIELQQHVAGLNDLKVLIPEKKKEIDESGRQIAQIDRKLGLLRVKIKRCRWSYTLGSGFGDGEATNLRNQLHEEYNTLIDDRGIFYRKWLDLKYEHKRLQDEFPGHQRNIQYLMHQLQLVVHS